MARVSRQRLRGQPSSTCGKKLTTTSTTVSAITIRTVIHATLLKMRPFLKRPISRRSLINFSITTKMMGSSTPLSVWLDSMALINDSMGSRMMPAPRTISAV